MRQWTKLNEAELKAGRAKGLKPAKSERGNLLLCSFSNCHKVAWEEFALPVAIPDTHTLEMHVFCSPEHQAAQLHEWGEL